MHGDAGRYNNHLASAHNDPPITGEWEVVKAAISQLDGVVPYSLVRGNHDDYIWPRSRVTNAVAR